MYYLYAVKPGQPLRLAATFDSQQQLRAYVSWATLSEQPDGTRKFEQGSALVGASGFQESETPLTEEDPETVLHNPTPSML